MGLSMPNDQSCRRRRRLLHVAMLLVALALVTSGCRTGAPSDPPPRIGSPQAAFEPTGTIEWGPTRVAPEMDQSILHVRENLDQYGDPWPLKGHKLGKGRFLGVVVSWVTAYAKTTDADSFAEVLVTPDGRIGAAPMMDLPFGFMTDGYTYGDDTTAMAAYKRDAVALAQQYVGPGVLSDVSADAKSKAKPFVSAYVLEYSWGEVAMSPAMEHEHFDIKPYGGRVFVRPLSAVVRGHLDSLTATEVAEAYLTSRDPDTTFWLLSPRQRLEFLYWPIPEMREAPTATVAVAPGVTAGQGYARDVAFTVKPDGLVDEEAYLFVGSRTTTSPWRVIGEGF